MIKISYSKGITVFVFQLLSCLGHGQQNDGVINIDTKNGHQVTTGASGFNVRIADKVWNYTHPDFRDAVHQLKPGWLRYFSGTMGDAFNSATGQYDLDYAMMFDKYEQYLKGYQFTEIKGPHRITDLYQLMGEINGKLIVTINAFSETPEITAELVRFIKNNHIKVEVWQFCNEPYFYVPHRERYWWNDGYDYAVKMKPHAEAILKTFPKAKMALNFTWDGIWGFMKEINLYQQEKGAYWNMFSKHSYAPHTGKQESLEDAYRRGNTKLLEATSIAAMQEIEDYTSANIPMAITEFGVWNKPLNGIYSSIYNIEYVMRQLQHPNTKFVGAHEVSSKYSPEKNLNGLITKAFAEGKSLNTDSLRTGVRKNLEGKAYEMYHEATNNTDFIYATEITNGFEVPGLGGTTVTGSFVQGYRGINGYDYLVVTNRSGQGKDFQVLVNGKKPETSLSVKYISAANLKVQNTEILEETLEGGTLKIRPFSVTLAKWPNGVQDKPASPRIYDLEVTKKGVKVVWGMLDKIEEYILAYGELGKAPTNEIQVRHSREIEVNRLEKGKIYSFSLKAKNMAGSSKPSDTLSVKFSIPKKPEIFKYAKRDDTVTLMWRSVAGAEGYMLKYISDQGDPAIVDTKNVYGYRLEGLSLDTPYAFSVASYNGLGQSKFSDPISITPKKNIPFSPRDVSAKETPDGSVMVRWVAQQNNPVNTGYVILRGEKPHVFDTIAKNITEAFHEDKTALKNKKYFYTVKARTTEGESNFYPNVATVIPLNKELSINITNITKQDNGDFKVDVSYKNVLLDGEYSYGVTYSNISYLNVLENKIEGQKIDKNKGIFEVIIPSEGLRKHSRFAIKAFINTNGKDVFSDLPHKIIKVE